MGDDNEKVLDIFFEGQKAIFAKLETLSNDMKAIPLQGLEIIHIKTAIAEMKVHCGKQHPEKEKTPEQPVRPTGLLRQIGYDLIRATAMFLFIVLAFTCFSNVQSYLNQKNGVAATNIK